MKRRLRSAFAPMVSATALEEQKHNSTCRIVDNAKAAEPAMSLYVQVFGRRPPQRVEGFVMPASKNLHKSRSLSHSIASLSTRASALRWSCTCPNSDKAQQLSRSLASQS
jgi:hypothetical protein